MVRFGAMLRVQRFNIERYSASAAVTGTIQTNVPVDLCICITLANSSETARVESYLVELIRG